MIMPRLYGERIMLREYKKEDLEHMRKWVNDPEVVNNLSDLFLFPHPHRVTESFLDTMLEGNAEVKGFVIADKETEAYIGQIDLIKTDWKNRVGTLGIVIGAKENRGKGIGEEAIRLLQDFAFNRLNLNKLELTLRDYNVQGYKCYQKCGFVEEGRIMQNFYVDGIYTDTIHMGVLKSEYEKSK